MKSVETANILKNKRISDNIFDMLLYCPQIAENSIAGQFVNVYTGRGEYILPRPISICEADKQKKTIRLVYQVVGSGTKIFSEFKENDSIQILGPLGNGFSLNPLGNHVIIGGGIGIPPLLELVKNLKGNIYVFLGSRTIPVLKDEFEKYSNYVYVSSDDGSSGFHGNVMQLVNNINPSVDYIYACGPKVMLNAVSKWAYEKNIDAQISMEERMACGIGACVGCAVKIRKKDKEDWENLKVCKDGPVFLSSEVVWD